MYHNLESPRNRFCTTKSNFWCNFVAGRTARIFGRFDFGYCQCNASVDFASNVVMHQNMSLLGHKAPNCCIISAETSKYADTTAWQHIDRHHFFTSATLQNLLYWQYLSVTQTFGSAHTRWTHSTCAHDAFLTSWRVQELSNNHGATGSKPKSQRRGSNIIQTSIHVVRVIYDVVFTIGAAQSFACCCCCVSNISNALQLCCGDTGDAMMKDTS